jgi:hypothetical protein
VTLVVPAVMRPVIDVGPLREERRFPASSCRNDEPALPIGNPVSHWIATCDVLAVGMAANAYRNP